MSLARPPPQDSVTTAGSTTRCFVRASPQPLQTSALSRAPRDVGANARASAASSTSSAPPAGTARLVAGATAPASLAKRDAIQRISRRRALLQTRPSVTPVRTRATQRATLDNTHTISSCLIVCAAALAVESARRETLPRNVEARDDEAAPDTIEEPRTNRIDSLVPRHAYEQEGQGQLSVVLRSHERLNALLDRRRANDVFAVIAVHEKAPSRSNVEQLSKIEEDLAFVVQHSIACENSGERTVRGGVTMASVQHRAEDAGEATGERVAESARARSTIVPVGTALSGARLSLDHWLPMGSGLRTTLCGARTGRSLRRASVPSVVCIANPAQPLGRCPWTAFGCGTSLRPLCRRLTDAPAPRRGGLAGRGQIQRIQRRPVRLQRDRQDQLSGFHVASSSPARTGSRKVWAALVTSSRVSHASWSSRAIAA